MDMALRQLAARLLMLVALVAIALIIKFLIWMEKPNGYKRFSTS